MNAYDHIEDYIDGKLSEEQRVAFEQAMIDDPSLASIIDNNSTLNTISSGILELQLLNEVETVANNINTQPHKKTTRNYWWVFLLAFCILIGILFFGIKHLKKDHHTITESAQYAINYRDPIWPISRNVADDDQLAKAISIFLNEEDITTAKSIIKSISPQSPIHQYWIAEMHAKSGQWDSVAIYLPGRNELSSKTRRIIKLQEWMTQ